MPQGLAGGGGVQRTTGLFRIVTVAGAPAGPRRRIVAPVGGIDHLLFALQRGGDRLIKGVQPLRDQGLQRPAVGGQIVLQPRISARAIGVGTEVIRLMNHTEISRVGKGIGISQRRLPLRAIKRLNIS